MNELASIDWASVPSRRELHRQLDRIYLPADAKVALAELTDLTTEIGEKVVEIGRRIVSFALELVRQFPNITFCVIIAAILTTLIASIPFLGPPLSALIGPVLMAAGVAVGSILEVRDGDLRGRISVIAREFESLIA